MNKKQQIQLAIIIVAIALLAIFSTSNIFETIPGEEIDIFLVDWDNWYEDTISGENEYMTWEPALVSSDFGDCTIETSSGFTGTRSLDFGIAGQNNGQGADVMITLKDAVNNIADYNTWCFGIYISGSIPYGSSESWLEIQLLNSTDVMMQSWRAGLVNSRYTKEFQVWANDGWKTIYSGSLTADNGLGWFWLNTTFAGGVTFNSSVWSKQSQKYIGTNYSGPWDFTPTIWNSSSKYQFNKIYIRLMTTNPSWAPILYGKVDDIVISSQRNSDYGFIYRNPFDPLKVTCYQCQNGHLVSDEFNNSCPSGWYVENELPNSNCSIPVTCGNGVVDPLETCLNCPQDVGECGTSVIDKLVINWWVFLGLILSGLSSVYIALKKKVKWRFVIYFIFIGFLVYFIYLFI